jgi:hypothetical protein
LQLSVERTDTPRLTSPRLTGGKSGRGFGRLDPHLRRGLERPPAELAEQVPHPFLRAVDQVPVGRIVDRVGHLTHRLLEVFPHPPNQLLTIDGRQAVHDCSFWQTH